MKRVLLFLIIISPLLALSHKPDEAFFTIISNNDTTIVTAELPWTAKRSLLAYSPKLKHSSNINEFKNEFFKYIKASFIMQEESGDSLVLLSVNEFHIDGAHTDQNNFTFKFLGSAPHKITNTILFNVLDTQKNFHTFPNNVEKITTLTQPNFIMPHNPNYWLPISLGLIVITFLFLINVYYKKNRA